MTAQIPDRLIHNGRALHLCAMPLETWLKRARKAQRPKFAPPSTALWRGYVATWEIVDGRLFLTDIDGAFFGADGELQDATLPLLFPRRPRPVPATWVTNTLRCPEGRLRAYAHAGFASEYERDRLFYIVDGVLEDEWLIYNPPAPLHYRIEPDGSRTYATAPNPQALAPEQDPFPADAPVKPWRLWGDPDWDLAPVDKNESQEGYIIGGLTRFE